MKKLLLSLMVLGALNCNAQNKFTKTHTPFVSGSYDVSLPSDISYGGSAELGYWGTTGVTSFSIVGDFMKNLPSYTNTNLLGIKAYYTFYQNDNSCYMVYLAPKITLDKSNIALVELGLNPNFTINKHMLASFTVCNQFIQNSYWNPSFSVGIVFLK